MRFWDSSALVPLLVAQPSSTVVDEWLAEDGELAVRTMTLVELASALMRLAREGAIGEREATEAESRIGELLRSARRATCPRRST